MFRIRKSLKLKRIRAGIADCSGLAAMESAFFIPMFLFATLAVFDLGRAGASRMEIDQALRAGAQVSMINITDEMEILNATLAAMGIASSGEKAPDGMCVPNTTCIDVNFDCKCTTGTSTTCASICVGTGEPPSAFLTIDAARRQEGVVFPDFQIESSIVVQTR